MSAGGTLGFGDGALAGVIGSAVGIALKSQGHRRVVSAVLVASLGYQLLTWRMQGDDVIARWIDAAAAARATCAACNCITSAARNCGCLRSQCYRLRRWR